MKELKEYDIERSKALQDPSYVPRANADYDIDALVSDTIDDLINAGYDILKLDAISVTEKVLKFTKGRVSDYAVRLVAERNLLATQLFLVLSEEEQNACRALYEHGLQLLPSNMMKLFNNRQQLLEKIQNMEAEKAELKKTIRMYRSRYLKTRAELGNLKKLSK